MKSSFPFLVLVLLAIPVLAKAETPTMCTMHYDPVCGTEKGVYKTYGNGCVLGAEGAIYQHEGECTAAELSGMQVGTYTPPAHCTAWFDGCNSCSRNASGQSMCTLMACMGEPKAGYCRAYGESQVETPPPPLETDWSGSVESADAEVVIEATTTAETDPGFLFGIWRAIAAWFRAFF